MAGCHTHAALPGGAAVSAAPTRAIVHQHCNPPTEFTEFTEASGVEEPPTDFTDAHRLGGYGILPYPRRHQTIFPQNPQNPQKFLTQDILPRISRMYTD